MSCDIIDGAQAAKEIIEEVERDVRFCTEKRGIVPHLAILMVGDNEASKIYVKRKLSKAASIGIKASPVQMPENASEKEVIEEVARLNRDNGIHGIIVQLPMPAHISVFQVLNEISPQKDVDGFTVKSAGMLYAGQARFVPCTAAGIMYLLKKTLPALSGLNAVILGRSLIVGLPTFHLLTQSDCSVTLLHSKSREVSEITKRADILISAIGKANFIDSSYVKNGACVIDVGISRKDNKICGDVNFDEVKDIASYITPVPGGVGPMTVAHLMKNVVKAALSV